MEFLYNWDWFILVNFNFKVSNITDFLFGLINVDLFCFFYFLHFYNTFAFLLLTMNNRPLQDDEFDIESLIYKLFLLLKKTFNWFLYPFKLMVLKPKRLAIIMSLLFTAAIIIRYTAPPIYKSYFLLRPANQIDLNFASMITDLQTLVKDNDYEELSSLLKIDQSLSEKIYELDFKTEKTNKYFKYSDSINAIVVFIYTYDRTAFDTIQSAILNYIENSDYYSKSRNIRMENIDEMERKLNKDMADIDSLKKVLTANAGPRNAGGFVYGEPLNPMSIYEKAILIYKEQLSLHYQKKYTASFELVKKCVTTKKRYWPRLSILLPAALVLSLIVNLGFNLNKKGRKSIA